GLTDAAHRGSEQYAAVEPPDSEHHPLNGPPGHQRRRIRPRDPAHDVTHPAMALDSAGPPRITTRKMKPPGVRAHVVPRLVVMTLAVEPRERERQELEGRLVAKNLE